MKSLVMAVMRLWCRVRGHKWGVPVPLEPDMSVLQWTCQRCREQMDNAPAMYWLIKDATDGSAATLRSELSRSMAAALDREIMGI